MSRKLLKSKIRKRNNKSRSKNRKSKFKQSKSRKTKQSKSRISRYVSGGANPFVTTVEGKPGQMNTSFISTIPFVGQNLDTQIKIIKGRAEEAILQDQTQPVEVIYNYKTTLQTEIEYNKPNKLSIIKVKIEPFITVNSYDRHLVVIYNATKYEVIFIAEFKNRSRSKVILSYYFTKMQPNETNDIKIAFIRYPEDWSEFTVSHIYDFDRKKVYNDLDTYLKNKNINLTNVKPSVEFSVTNDSVDYKAGFEALRTNAKNTIAAQLAKGTMPKEPRKFHKN